MIDFGFNPIGGHTTDTTVSGATTLTNPGGGATKLLLQAITQNVRFTLDESTPTATVGFRITAGDPPMLIPVRAGQDIILIEETASAVVAFQWGN